MLYHVAEYVHTWIVGNALSVHMRLVSVATLIRSLFWSGTVCWLHGEQLLQKLFDAREFRLHAIQPFPQFGFGLAGISRYQLG